MQNKGLLNQFELFNQSVDQALMLRAVDGSEIEFRDFSRERHIRIGNGGVQSFFCLCRELHLL